MGSRSFSDPGDEPSEPTAGVQQKRSPAQTDGADQQAGAACSAAGVATTPDPVLPSQPWMVARSAAKVSGQDSLWNQGILKRLDGFEQPESTLWVHAGRGLPSRRRQRRLAARRSLSPIEAGRRGAAQESRPGGHEDDTNDGSDDDDSSVTQAASSKPELSIAEAESKWNGHVAERFCEYEAQQAACMQDVVRDMQTRVSGRLDELFGTAAVTSITGGDRQGEGSAGMNDGSSETTEQEKIRQRRRQRGQHRIKYDGATKDTDVLHSDLVAATRQGMETVVGQVGESERNIHWRLFVDGLRADNHRQLQIVQHRAETEAEAQGRWARQKSQQRVHMSGLLGQSLGEEAARSLARSQSSTTGSLRTEIAAELAAAAEARRLTASIEKEHAAGMKAERRQQIESESALKTMRNRQAVLEQRIVAQKKALQSYSFQVAQSEQELALKDRRLAVLEGIQATQKMRPEEAAMLANRRALHFQSQLSATRAGCVAAPTASTTTTQREARR